MNKQLLTVQPQYQLSLLDPKSRKEFVINATDYANFVLGLAIDPTLESVLATSNTTGPYNIVLSDTNKGIVDAAGKGLFFRSTYVDLHSVSNESALELSNNSRKEALLYGNSGGSVLDLSKNTYFLDPVGSVAVMYTTGRVGGIGDGFAIAIRDNALDTSFLGPNGVYFVNTTANTHTTSPALLGARYNGFIMSPGSTIGGGAAPSENSMIISSLTGQVVGNYNTIISSSDSSITTGVLPAYSSIIASDFGIMGEDSAYTAYVGTSRVTGHFRMANVLVGGGNLITTSKDNTFYTNQMVIQQAGSLFDGVFTTAALTAERTYTFQDASGTVAFLGDMTLEKVLTTGNTTGANNILITNGQYVENTLGGGRLVLGSNWAEITTDSGVYGTQYIFMDGTEVDLYQGAANGKIFLSADNTGGFISFKAESTSYFMTATQFISRGDISIQKGGAWDGILTTASLSSAQTYTFPNQSGVVSMLSDFQTGQTYTPSNVVTTRTFDANTVDLPTLADVVGTLIADLQATPGDILL